MQKILSNLADLLKVKTLVTMAITAVFVAMSLRGAFAPELVMTVITMVMSFYFGIQHERRGGGSDGDQVAKEP